MHGRSEPPWRVPTMRRLLGRIGSSLLRLAGFRFMDVECPDCDGKGEVVHDIDCEQCALDGGLLHAHACPTCGGASVLDAIYRPLAAIDQEDR